MPITAEAFGEPVSTLALVRAVAVLSPEITLSVIVCAKAPETFIPVIFALVPLDRSEMLLIKLLEIEDAALEEIPL